MAEIPALIIDLTILLVVAAVTTLLCKKIRLPSVLGYILAGVLAGPVVSFLPTVTDMENVEIWSEIGVIFLMFGLGLEFSVHKMKEVGLSGFLSAGIQATGMGVTGFFLGALLGWGTMNSVFLGVMLAMSSTMITMKNIEDLGLKKAAFSELAMGTLVIEDIIAIFSMVILSTIAASNSISGSDLAIRIGILLLYLVIWMLLGIYLLPTLMKRLMGLMNDEVLLVFSLGLCFLMALLAEEIGFSMELGAFLAGSLLAGTVHAEKIEHLVTPCKNLFGAVFFISVGFMIEPAMIVQYLPVIVLISAVAVIGKLLFLTVGGITAGHELEDSVKAGAAQTQVGEFSFIIAGLGQSLGVTAPFLYPVIVAVSVLTTFTTPFVLRASGKISGLIRRILPKRMMFMIDAYGRARRAEKPEQSGDWASFLRHYLRAFGLYGALSCGVILLGAEAHSLMRGALEWKPWAISLTVCAVVYPLLLLFLYAMLRTRKRYFTALWLNGYANRVLLCVLLIFRAAVAVVLLIIPAFLCFAFNPLWLAVAAVPVVVFVTRSKTIAGRYLEVEARFLANLNERKLAEHAGATDPDGSAHHWLTEQLYVARFRCPPGSEGDGMTLRSLDWGNREHVKVIRIRRGKECLNIPEGVEPLRGGDVLTAMGAAKSLENFTALGGRCGLEPVEGGFCTLKEYIEAQDGLEQSQQILFCGVQLKKRARQDGKSIKNSGIKTDWSAFLIGIERKKLPILDPDPNMLLRSGDLLWVMGSQEMVGKLSVLGLLD